MKSLVFVFLFLILGTAPCQGQTQAETDHMPEIMSLVDSLSQHPWKCPVEHYDPEIWQNTLTDPMKALLAYGPEAQTLLLARLQARENVEQIIILLGGVGDEATIEPIIEAMKWANEEGQKDSRFSILLAGNIALTNLTVADVIWHHGGGLRRYDDCPADSSNRWSIWWGENRTKFRIKEITQSRSYTNYPNYGIYGTLP